MSYNDASGPLGPLNSQFGPFTALDSSLGNGAFSRGQSSRDARGSEQDAPIFHGEALARDFWGERYGAWIVLGFTAGFALFLIGMVLLGQTPGKSFLLKSCSDILQFVGEGIGLFFCLRIALRLRQAAFNLRQALLQRSAGQLSPNELAAAHSEAQLAQRAYLAWALLTIALALYVVGQIIWSSYDVRMNSADVPFPGIYDICFVGSYPFFLIGTLLLTRRGKATVGRARLILDALAFIGAALALSWFFLLGPSIAALSQQPGTGAAFLSVYFPTGDLFLVAIGAFLMFSPLANRAQQPVFLLLCMGLFFLAVTDSLLAYYNLMGGFNTGTVQDVLWPLSLSLIGLAAVEYPRSVARDQEQSARSNNPALSIRTLLAPSRLSQFGTTAQTISPFILVLATCALLITVVAPRGGVQVIQADIIALALIIIVVIRQALTLLENNRLTLQMRGELVISRRELQVTRREADEATRSAQEKGILEEGVAALRAVHARVARGDLSARAPTVSGPLLPIAISLNLMLDRLGALSQRGSKYDQLARECKLLQEAIERLGQGLPPLAANQPAIQSATELRSAFLGLSHLHRIQESQARRIVGTLESMSNLARRIHEALTDIRSSNLFSEPATSNFERMILERVLREVDLLEQQQRNLLDQVAHIGLSANQREVQAITPVQTNDLREQAMQQQRQRMGQKALQSKPASLQSEDQNSYTHRLYQTHHVYGEPIEE